ncbi:GNAT family N-acetyltransferase [Evansella halocellulosilytica]|uniref:GNAT family N-acetyltransferase n=1 Tax=Evansella halocellulosilytica TaxID=2011013 RepID=UPI000BB7C9D5|nr:GNAT family N-acetyltransferase [Evansella halocellulosilytica]
MNEKMNIIQYRKEFEDDVIKLIIKIQRNEFNVPISVEDQPDLFNVKEIYQTGKGNFWIATIHQKVVGTIGLLDIGNEQVALKKMFVHAQYRGRVHQTASKLLTTAFEWCMSHSVREIYLGTTPQFLAAHRFYEKNGFVQVQREHLPKSFPALAVDKKFYKREM